MRILTIIILALFLSFAAIPAAAQPASSRELAAYVPPDVLFYAQFKVDAATVDAIDSLIANLSGRIGLEPPETFAGLFSILGLRSWLGGEAAVAVLPSVSMYDLTSQSVALIEIKNRAEVEAFFRAQEDIEEIPTTHGISVFILNGIGVQVTDTLVILSTGTAAMTLPAESGPSLAAHQPYLDAIGALPADEYAATAYLDPRGLVFMLAGSAPEVAGLSLNLPVLSDSLGVFAAGLVQLDDRSYAIDVAHIYGARHPFEALYAPAPDPIASAPIDPAWLEFLPDTVVFAGQFSRPWLQFRALVEATGIAVNAIRPAFAFSFGMNDAPPFNSGVILNAVEGLLGMSDAEITAAFDGQAAVAFSIRDANGAPALDALLTLQSPDLDASHSVLRAVRGILPLLNVDPSEAGDDDLIFTAPGGIFESPLHLLADTNAVYFGSDALILADKQFFVAVPRLTDAEPFVHDRAFFLPDATNLAYIHLPPLRKLYGTRGSDGLPLLDDTPEFRNLLDTFDSFWISARTEPSRSVARLAFTLTP